MKHVSREGSYQKTPILRREHLHTALRAAVQHMKREEEARCGVGWRSTQRQVLEEALESLDNGRSVDIQMGR